MPIFTTQRFIFSIYKKGGNKLCEYKFVTGQKQTKKEKINYCPEKESK